MRTLLTIFFFVWFVPDADARPVVVVIDPGHGGTNHGARSPDGILEKHVVLTRGGERDLAQLHRNGAVFSVEDPQREQARADALELSPSGPMPGPDMMAPRGVPLEIELQELKELGLSGEEFDGLPFGLARGERRPLRCPIRSAAARAHEHGVRVGFTLPKGCYATSVLRELLNDTVWFARG